MTTSSSRKIRRVLAICGVCLALAACSTPSTQRPPPRMPEPETEPPPPATTERTTQPPASEPQAAETYLPPSEDAAEVQMEEIPLQTGATPSPAAAQSARAGAERAAGGGRSGLEAADTAASTAHDAATGTVLLTPGADRQDPDLVGPAMRVGARTEAEQLAALEGELDRKLADFDERMRRARAAAEAEKLAPPAGGGVTGALDGAGARREAPSERGAGGAAASGTGLGNTPDLVGQTGGGSTPVAVAATPPDLPDGRDDDIVARQLREAATKETDPVLREKLWEEYRKYKAGL